MRRSNKKSDQIIDNKVVEDYADILSKKELNNIVLSSFTGTELKNDNNIYGEHSGKKYCIFLKNVSYLGNPHPIFKKRIQIPSSFTELYNQNKENGITTLLLGIYSYKNLILFCDFDTTKYIENNVNNSSAHIYTIDLLNGSRNGYFSKKDSRGNEITVFNKENVELFLNLKLGQESSSGFDIFDTFDDFFASIGKEWFGIDCYMEMIQNDFQNKYQPEWPGFFLEYKLDEYLEKNHKKDIIIYSQNKKSDDIDLDLFFPKLGIYGDLKAHSSYCPEIQGNDYETIMNLIDTQSIYYVVCNHDTKKDKDNGYIVTEFWNKKLNKDNLHSYGNRMKHSVTLRSYCILELNKYNKKYLKIYNQGKNSDGNKREPKIKINKTELDNFIVHIVDFNNE